MANPKKLGSVRNQHSPLQINRPDMCRSTVTFGALIAVAFLLVIVPPVSAGEKYMAGSPELTAAIAGTNEFSPGDAALLSVMIQNNGLNEFKFVQSGIIDRDDLPNTAKLITITLGSGDSPITIKSDPQMIGDLKGGSSTLVNFNAKITRDAAAGTYQLPLNIKYKYLYEADQYGTDTIQYFYKVKNETILLPVRIKPELQFSIVSADADQINAGSEGYLTLVVNNTGQEAGERAILKIARNGNSPIVPTDSSTYIGDFPPGTSVSGKFKVQVSKDAENQTYPMDIYLNYKNYEGDVVDTEITTIGLTVGRSIDFVITSDPAEVVPGVKRVITVQYKNIGGATVYSAQARISAVDPFSSNDDTAYLGTFAPGETKEATFEISVDGSAPVKEYGLDSEIRFRDSLDNSMISDPLKVQIMVSKNSGAAATLIGNPLILGIIAVGVIGTGGIFYRRRQKR